MWWQQVAAILLVTSGRLGVDAVLTVSSVAAGDAATAVAASTWGAGKKSTDVYYMPELLDKLKLMAQQTHEDTIDRFKTERDRIIAVLRTLPAGLNRDSVDMAGKYNMQDTMETEVATLEMLQFYYTTKGMLGSQATAPHCRFLACGENADCQPSKIHLGRVQCMCNKCYKGNGFECKKIQCTPGTLGSAQPVRGPVPQGYPHVPRQAPGKVVEMQVSLFGQDQLAIVLRDATEENRGSLVLGRVDGVEVKWGFRQFLTPSAAYGPVVKGLPNGRLVLGFRDRDRGGVSYLLGGQVEGAEAVQANLTAPHRLAKEQSNRMVLVPMASSRLVCLYADREVDASGHLVNAWGSASLVEVIAGGHLRILSTFRFNEGMPVARLSAVPLSPTSLVVAYRAMPPKGSSKPQEASRELSALWIGMEDDELVIDPHAIALEAEHGAMWARDVALVAQNTFQYSYESAQERVLKVAVVKVDPATHRMTVVGAPQQFSTGSTHFLDAVSLPLYPDVPSALTVFQRPKENCKLALCRVSPEGRVADCHEKVWADQELEAVSGGRLLDGRLLFAMVDMQGSLLYQLLTHEDIKTE